MGGDEKVAFGNGLAQAFLRVVMAQAALRKSLLQIRCFHAFATPGAAHGSTLGHQRFGTGKNGALAGLVIHLAVGVLQ